MKKEKHLSWEAGNGEEVLINGSCGDPTEDKPDPGLDAKGKKATAGILGESSPPSPSSSAGGSAEQGLESWP